ncbi:MAG: PAS domain S-box protein, partial [Candidatus Omnitrophota bacterium]
MIQCKSNYNAWFKVIAITVLCLFTLNNLVWANPDIFQKNSPYITNDQNLAAMLGSVETSILTTVKAYVDSLGVKFFTESERHIFSKGPRGEWIYLDSYPEIPANWEGDNFILNCRLGSATREVIVTPDGNVSLREKADKQKEVVENIIDAAKAREPEQPPRADLDHKQPSYLVHYFEQGEERPLVRGLMSPLVLPHEIGNLIQALITGRWKDIKEPSWVNLFHGWVYKNKAPPCVGGILTSILTGVISLLFTNKFLMFYGMINLIYAGMEITYFLIREARSLKITGFGMDFASRSPAQQGINVVDTNKPDWFQEAFWRCAAAKVKSEKVKRNRINAEDWYYGATVIPWYERQINKLKRKLSEEEINTSLLKILLRVKKVQLSRFSSAEERETADLVKQQAFGIYFEVNTKRVNINPVFEYNPLTKTWEIDGKVTYIWENLLKEDADVVVEAYKKAALAEAQGKPEAADLKAEASILMEIAGKRLEEAKARLYSLTIDQGNKGPVTLLPGFAVLAFGGDELFSMYTLGIVFGILLAVMILRWTYDTGRIQRFMNKHPRVKGVLGSMFGADPEEQEISDILFRNAPVPFHVLDHEGKIIMVNQKWLETFGYKMNEVVGRRIFDFIIPEQRENAEQRFKARIRIHQIKQLLHSKKLSASSYAALAKELANTKMPERKDKDGVKDEDRVYLRKDGSKIIAITDDTITENKVITSFLDITGLRKAEDEKEDIARRDPGTGLYNLRHLRAELKEAIVRSEVAKKEAALFLINLDDYEEIKKDTNRTFVAELAKTLGGQIQECLREEKNGDAYTLAYIDSGLYAVIVRGNGKETIQEKIRTLSRKIFRSL